MANPLARKGVRTFVVENDQLIPLRTWLIVRPEFPWVCDLLAGDCWTVFTERGAWNGRLEGARGAHSTALRREWKQVGGYEGSIRCWRRQMKRSSSLTRMSRQRSINFERPS
jgi:hypothetical protein